MPPAALISLIASSTPFLKLVPAVAPVPDSSWITAILICAWAVSAASRQASTVMAGSVGVMRSSNEWPVSGVHSIASSSPELGHGAQLIGACLPQTEELQVKRNLLEQHVDTGLRTATALPRRRQERCHLGRHHHLGDEARGLEPGYVHRQDV